jgi:hypothetical protein
MNKKSALKVIKGYKASPKQALKQLAKEYRSRLKRDSSPTTPEIRGEVKPHQKKQSVRTKNILQENRKTTKTYLKNPKNKNQSGYKRIEKASKKYIDASPYELRNGINSYKSQKYRERNGLSVKYEGRIIK